MIVVVIDTETTISNKGNPFDVTNKLCYVGAYVRSIGTKNVGYYDFDIEYSDTPYGHHIQNIQQLIDEADLLVFFNAKFDIHWLRRYGIKIPEGKKIWDCQLCYFLYRHQQTPMPSLNEVCAFYGVDGKVDGMLEYWENGIDTPYVPREQLRKYLKQDCISPYQVFINQWEYYKDSPKLPLLELEFEDLLVLEEMEYNGFLLNVQKCKELSKELVEAITELDDSMRAVINCVHYNPNSPEHASAILYGGKIKYRAREPVEKTYKYGTVFKEQWVEKEVKFPRLVQPLEGSAGKKKGVWSTNEDFLKMLRGNEKAQKIIAYTLKRKELTKRLSTYLQGLPLLLEEKKWHGNIIHGQIHQVVAVTGRTSSSGPNLQNTDSSIKEIFITRFQ